MPPGFRIANDRVWSSPHNEVDYCVNPIHSVLEADRAATRSASATRQYAPAASEILAGGLRGHAEPLSVTPCPVIHISADALDARFRPILDSRMDDREVPKKADVAEFADARAFANKIQEFCTVI